MLYPLPSWFLLVCFAKEQKFHIQRSTSITPFFQLSFCVLSLLYNNITFTEKSLFMALLYIKTDIGKCHKTQVLIKTNPEEI